MTLSRSRLPEPVKQVEKATKVATSRSCLTRRFQRRVLLPDVHASTYAVLRAQRSRRLESNPPLFPDLCLLRSCVHALGRLPC